MSSHHFSSISIALILLLAIVTSFITPSVSTSRHALNYPDVQTGFKVTLKHVDSGKNLTKFELLQRAMKRGKKRMHRLHAMALSSSSSSDANVESPVHAGSGEFLMQLSIGSPAVAYSAILDTGSDLIWTQCKPCQKCFKQPTPVFDPKSSSSYSKLSCSSDLCEALPTSSCNDQSCEYMYSYGDYSSTQGVMGVETFTFDDVKVPKVAFGCGLDNDGSGFEQGGGLVGMGRGPLSLVSQLDEPKFSYCLTSVDSTKASVLLMGSKAGENATLGAGDSIKTTPLIKSPSSPTFYYLSLEGITVGDKLLPIDKSAFALQADGSGGMIIDSGTTITYLEESAFEVLKDEFTSQMKLPVDNSNDSGLELCFSLPTDARDIDVPNLVFHFDGADLELPSKNYMIADTSGVVCLAMGSSTGISIFGNFQQQDTMVVHDLVKESISFVPTKCDQL